jgi:hypothetical protein
MKASNLRLIESFGAAVFVPTATGELRLHEGDFHRAYVEPVVIWIMPGSFDVQKTESLLDAAKELHAVRTFRFPNVVVPDQLIARVRAEFSEALIQGARDPNDPIPSVSDADVERVIQRDFAPENFSRITALLSEITGSASARTKLAILKLVRGPPESLQTFVEQAKCDFRDVLIAAEYSHQSEFAKWDSEEAKIRAVDQDWTEYQAWLHAKNEPP